MNEKLLMVKAIAADSGVQAWNRQATQMNGYCSPRLEVMDGDFVTWVGGACEGDAERAHTVDFMKDSINQWRGNKPFWLRITRNIRSQIHLKQLAGHNATPTLQALVQMRVRQVQEHYDP